MNSPLSHTFDAKRNILRADDDGNYFVMLSLAEAAAVRAALHTAEWHGQPLLNTGGPHRSGVGLKLVDGLGLGTRAEAIGGGAGGAGAGASGGAGADGGLAATASMSASVGEAGSGAGSGYADDMWLLDASAGFVEQVEARPSTQLRSRQCIRFADSNTHFDERSIFALVEQLVAVAASPDSSSDSTGSAATAGGDSSDSDGAGMRSCAAREKWWTAVRRCRRRPPVAWQDTPLRQVFTTKDGLVFVERNTLELRIALAVYHHFGTLRDAFEYFDYDRSGSLTKEELYGGLKKLVGPTVRPDMVRQIVSHIDSDGNGEVSFEEFSRALGDSVSHLRRHGSVSAANGGKQAHGHGHGHGHGGMSPAQPSRLEDETDGPSPSPAHAHGGGSGSGAGGRGGQVLATPSSSSSSSPSVARPLSLSAGQLRAITVEVGVVLGGGRSLTHSASAHSLLEKVWDNYGTGSFDSVSIWRLKQPPTSSRAAGGGGGGGGGFIGLHWGSSERLVPLGHLVSAGYDLPPASAPLPVLRLSVSRAWGDRASIDLAVEQLLRKPRGYKLAWKKLFGEKDFFAWRPKPPEGYVALGMVGTNSAKKPPNDAIRCVPAGWLVGTRSPLRAVWTDAGGTGGSVGSIWAAPAVCGLDSGAVGLVVVSASEARPAAAGLLAFPQAQFNLEAAVRGDLARR